MSRTSCRPRAGSRQTHQGLRAFAEPAPRRLVVIGASGPHLEEPAHAPGRLARSHRWSPRGPAERQPALPECRIVLARASVARCYRCSGLPASVRPYRFPHWVLAWSAPGSRRRSSRTQVFCPRESRRARSPVGIRWHPPVGGDLLAFAFQRERREGGERRGGGNLTAPGRAPDRPVSH
jgi:hypothetical protein